PKVALAIVSGYSPGEHRRAIVREDAALFETIPGIGRKTAQRVVLELKEKLAPIVAVAESGRGERDGHRVARDALVELGYSVAEADERLAETDPELPAAERVRQALRAA
ncbi:MAG: helix-hairpin-helix domain-containing protein, partial [Actinomycetota bacterium]|nr:helix-hairpin-helix domain-containing protein [Actinomycetota bacterium]